MDIDPDQDPADTPIEGEKRRSGTRRQPMTRELRRFLGRGRSWHDKEAARQEQEQSSEESLGKPVEFEPPPQSTSSSPELGEPPRTASSTSPRTSPSGPVAVSDRPISRALEMQTVVLVVGVLILIGSAF